jgi:hypothetical protein
MFGVHHLRMITSEKIINSVILKHQRHGVEVKDIYYNLSQI